MSIRRLAVVAALVVATASCGETDGVTTLPGTLFPIGEGTWYMHEANDSTLSATVSTRIIGVTQETVIVDSSRLTVNLAGEWEQRYWVRVLHANVLDRAEVVLDFGSWAKTGNTYTLTSSLRTRSFAVMMPSPTELLTEEQMVFYENADLVSGLYRQIRP